MKSYALNNDTYTLVEALLGIILMGVLIGLCMNFMIVLNKTQTYDYSKEEMIVFLSQIQEDLLQSKEVALDGKILKLTTYNGKEIDYMQDQARFVRKIESEGYEIMLDKVKEIDLENVDNLLKINVIFNNGYEYEGVLGAIK